MKLIQPKTRHLKFTINEKIVTQYPLTEMVDIKYEAGTEENYTWFGLRWTVNFLNKEGLEAIIQLSESRSIFEKEESKKDKADLKAFAQKAFVSIQSNLLENLPTSLKHLSIAEPNFDTITESLMVQIQNIK